MTYTGLPSHTGPKPLGMFKKIERKMSWVDLVETTQYDFKNVIEINITFERINLKFFDYKTTTHARE